MSERSDGALDRGVPRRKNLPDTDQGLMNGGHTSRVRKEVKAMKYAKPTIIELLPAIDAVQNSQKGSSDITDLMKEQTVGAYQADE